jgi:hypothetical protein
MDTTYPQLFTLDPGGDVTARFQRFESGHCRDQNTGKLVERAIAILSIDGIERSLWLHETALRGQFKELWPEPGETVRIRKAAAKKLGGAGRYYWPIRVTAPDRPAETIDRSSPLFAAGADDDTEARPTSDVPNDFASYGEPPAQAAGIGTADESIPF